MVGLIVWHTSAGSPVIRNGHMWIVDFAHFLKATNFLRLVVFITLFFFTVTDLLLLNIPLPGLEPSTSQLKNYVISTGLRQNLIKLEIQNHPQQVLLKFIKT